MKFLELKRKTKYYLPALFKSSWWHCVSFIKAENTNERVFRENVVWVFTILIYLLPQEKIGLFFPDQDQFLYLTLKQKGKMFASSSAALSSQSVLTQNNPEISDYFSLFSVYFAEVTQGPFKDQLIKLKHTENTQNCSPSA